MGSSFQYGLFNYTVLDASNNVSIISLINIDTSGIINIPTTFTYSATLYTVTTLSPTSFTNASKITGITIPYSVTSIPSIHAAFTGTSRLEFFNVQGTNTVFSSLDNVLFNKDKTILYSYPKGLTDVSYSIPVTVTTVWEQAFVNCTFLTSLIIPDSVTSIGVYVFSGCTAVTSFTLPSNLTRISDGMIRGCIALPSITIPHSVTSIGDIAFENCENLTSITIPDRVTSIGYRTFEACSRLQIINVPAGVTSIGEDAFSVCYNLTSITIPASVTSIGVRAFFECRTLENVYFEGNIPTLGEGAFTVPGGINNTSYYMNSATGTSQLNSEFTNIVQLKFISQNGGVTTSNVGNTSGKIIWNPIPNVIKGTYSGTIIYSITLSSSIVHLGPLSENSFTFTNLQPNKQYNYTVSYSINPDLETVPGSLSTSGIISGICFIGSTQIATDQGDIEIQNISTKKHTIRGQQIDAITRTEFYGKNLIKIEKDAFMKNVPNKDVVLTTEHQVMYKKRMVRAIDLLNMRVSEKIQKIKYNGEIMYNILMENHGIMVAQNMIVETLHPENMIAKVYRDLNFNELTLRQKCKIIRELNSVFQEKMNSANNANNSKLWKIV